MSQLSRMRSRLVLEIISACFRRGVWPGNYFQLNAPYFNDEKGVFSKLDLQEVIPERWQLKSLALDAQQSVDQWENQILQQFTFPLFLKPEWGQNSHGIFRVDAEEDLRPVLEQIATFGISYFCQEAAHHPREFEVFFVRSVEHQQSPAVFTVTESCDLQGQRLPIHSVLNGTKYQDLSADMTAEMREMVWKHVSSLADFKMARCALRARSLEDLVEGNFQIVEINLFLPMPLNLLDHATDWKVKRDFMKSCSQAIAASVEQLDSGNFKSIFWRKTRRHLALTKKASFQQLHQHEA